MKKYIFAAILQSLVLFCQAQETAAEAYAIAINDHRQQYKNDFLTDSHAPLKAQDTAFLDFYPPDPAWRIPATVELTPEAASFDLPTYSGQTRLYRQYAVVHFKVNGQPKTLNLYQNLALIAKDSTYKDYLFLPFKDLTNGEETYGGGRYLDFKMKDIRNGLLLVDFNKNYNPYCAYSDGYSCPIPPKENHLDIEVRAGEKNFRKEKMHSKH